MKEPFLSHFCELIGQGAAKQDIYDAAVRGGYAVTSTGASDAFVRREVSRVEAHQRSLIPLLEQFVGRAASVLDVGCSTGGTTVALALSPVLRPDQVVGVDPNRLSVEAARVRARGYDLPPERVRFEATTPGTPLPFPDARFRLTVCVSVLEFISTHQGRRFLAGEMERVTEPGGFIFLATPTPFRWRELHSRRRLGHFYRREGYPWSSTPWTIRRMFPRCSQTPIHPFLLRERLDRLRVPGARLLLPFSGVLSWAWRWQKFLFRKDPE